MDFISHFLQTQSAIDKSDDIVVTLNDMASFKRDQAKQSDSLRNIEESLGLDTTLIDETDDDDDDDGENYLVANESDLVESRGQSDDFDYEDDENRMNIYEGEFDEA